MLIQQLHKDLNIDNLTLPCTISYCDGSCNWKNKIGGYGGIIWDVRNENIVEIFQGFSDTTVGRMELLGMINILKRLNVSDINYVYCDSMYVVKTCNEWIEYWEQFKFQGKKNIDLLEILSIILKKFTKTKLVIKHIKGHVGYMGNELADALAKKGYLEMLKTVETNL